MLFRVQDVCEFHSSVFPYVWSSTPSSLGKISDRRYRVFPGVTPWEDPRGFGTVRPKGNLIRRRNFVRRQSR